MRIVLVRPNWNVRWMIVPPLGLGYIAAAAKQAGHECVIYDAWLNNRHSYATAVDIGAELYDIIGIQIFQDTTEWTKRFIGYIRAHSKAKIIVGGPYVTALGDAAREEVGADVGIQGEADSNFIGMLNHIQGIDAPETIGMPFANVNLIPMPDYDSFNLSDYWPYLYPATVPVRGMRSGHITTTRGCSSHCTFCAAGTVGHKVRFRDIDNILDEVKYLKHRYNIDEVWFQDDNILVNYVHAMTLFERLVPLKLHIRLPSGIRWEHVDYPMVKTMHKAGVYYTGMGIESGNPRVLKRIKKSIKQDKLKEAIRILVENGILVMGFFIFGLPTETREEMEDTIRYALETRLHHAQFGTFIPYPGSEDYHERSLYPHDVLMKVQKNAYLRFYLRPRIIWSFIEHFRWSQLKAIFQHPWVKQWRSK